MEREPDLAYFERRAREERRKAETANDPLSYRLHTDFARAYVRKVMQGWRTVKDNVIL